MQQVFGELFIKLVTQMSHVSNMTQINLLANMAKHRRMHNVEMWMDNNGVGSGLLRN